MKHNKTKLLWALLLTLTVLISGCQPSEKKAPDESLSRPDDSVFETTLSSMAQLYQTGTFNVEAYGLVAGLQGTGSSECEPFIRTKLVKHIQKQTKNKSTKAANNLINSMDTAVVYVRGVIPALALGGETFDLQVFPLQGTQTTSLEGGRLYSVDLTQNANVNYANPVAYASGPIFVNKISGGNGASGGYYVLGGGRVIDDAPLSLWLNKPNYYTSNAIRNRINQRFGPNTANAISDKEIKITFPKKYLKNKGKFITMIEQLYLGTDSRLTQNRIDMLTKALINDQDKYPAEIALEVIGKDCIKTIAPLLESDNESVRFHAARCLMNLGNSKGLKYLKNIAYTHANPHRLDAINSIGSFAPKKEALKILDVLLSDPDYEIAFAAYNHLRKLKSLAITQKVIAGDFLVENVITEGPNIIYISRSKFPRIVIFGAPIECNADVFAKNEDGSVVISGQTGDKYLSLMRKHPTKPTIVGPVKSLYDVSDVIRTMGEMPNTDDEQKTRDGLGVPYSDIIEIIESMCLNHMVNAELKAGAMTEVKPLTQSAGNNQ